MPLSRYCHLCTSLEAHRGRTPPLAGIPPGNRKGMLVLLQANVPYFVDILPGSRKGMLVLLQANIPYFVGILPGNRKGMNRTVIAEQTPPGGHLAPQQVL